MLIWFLPVFLLSLLLGLPVLFALLAAPGILLWLNGQERDITLLYRNIYNGIDSFPLMAIPFFMLAGELMNRSRITAIKKGEIAENLTNVRFRPIMNPSRS